MPNPFMLRAARLPGLVVLVLSTLAVGGTADAAAAPASKDYKSLRAIGPAKRAQEGLLRVKLRDSTTVLTHGLDPQPAAPERAVDFAGPERQPVCASDYYQHVLYGYPAGTPSRLSSVTTSIRSEIRRMDALLNEEALASGGRTADYKVLCDAAGEIRVDAFQSTEADAQTTFAGVVSAARQAGFDTSKADYTIFFDSSAPSACGTGTYSDDQRLSAQNANNSGGGYAVVYSDCWSDRTAMHENGHNQGAVQYDAPHSTGNGAHCNDGYDIMCYADGGDKDVGMSVFCSDKMRFDCGHDTYFDTAPQAGEYLAANWNLGSPLNRFITFNDGGERKAACEDGLDNDGDGVADFPRDIGCSAPTDTDEVDLPACLDLRDNDGDGRTDFPSDPGCTSVLDSDETDPGRPVAGPPAQASPPQLLAQVRRLPTLTMAAARRYARKRIKRGSSTATRIRTRCTRRTRTSAACRVRWRVGRRAGYRGNMVIRYRFHNSRPALVASSRVRRDR